MRKNNKRNKITFIILGLLLIISIGYAALTTVLKINSNILVSKASFDIHFDNVAEANNKANVTEEAHITNDAKTEIAFSIGLEEVDDYYKFTTDIVNEGSIPGKITSIELNGLTESQKKIISYKVFYTTSKKTVAIGDYFGPHSAKNVTIEILYQLADDISNDDLPTEDLPLECTFIIHFENGNMNEFRARAASNRLMQQTDYFPTTFLDFTKPASSDEHQGIYRLDGTEDDDFPIYFYRGSNSYVNNHVNFGGYCWRIIRTTETGGIKLIYNGVPNDNGQCNNLTGSGTRLATHAIGDSRNYSTGSLKTWLSTWYFEHFIQNQAYLEDTPFCNDISYSIGNVSLDCDSNYVVSMANGKNNYPIGLISAKEVNLCGQGNTGSYTYGWLNNGDTYWTMSGSTNGNNRAWYLNSGYMNNNGNTGESLGIRPVISLNSEVVLSGGNGTQQNPYTVSLG